MRFGALRPGMITFDRPRNGDGEFAPESDGGVDSATMQAAYGPPQPVVKKGSTASGRGGTDAAAHLAQRLRARGFRAR